MKRMLCLLAGAAVFLLLQFVPLEGLSFQGQTYLALTAMTLVFWCTQPIQTGYAAGLYLVLLVLLKVAPSSEIFSCWTEPTMWLIVSAYLLSSAIRHAGLGERIAYFLISRFMKGYRSTVVTTMILSCFLAIIIPHPWPRMFLILSVTEEIVRQRGLSRDTSRILKFCVCAFSCSTSLLFLTSDNILTGIALDYAGASVPWLRWFAIMGVPTAGLCALVTVGFLLVFRPTKSEMMLMAKPLETGAPRKAFSDEEKKTAIWAVISIVLWATDFLHGIPLGWMTLAITMFMSMPGVGVLTAESWKEIPVHVLVLVTATFALAGLGQSTGLNEWLVGTLLPEKLPSGLLISALFMAVVTMCAHMFMGSAIPVMCVLTPTFITYGTSRGVSALAVAMICYIVAATHYALPFHHLNLVIGAGAEDSYGSRETLRFAPVLTICVLLAVGAVYLPWWSLMGILTL